MENPSAGASEFQQCDIELLASQLEKTARAARRLLSSSWAREPITRGDAPAERVLREQIAWRDWRALVFSEEYYSFPDPLWDILLDLMRAKYAGEEVSVSSLCIASRVASSTAMRWIGHATARGILKRRPDPNDRRRVYIEMGESTEAMMIEYLSQHWVVRQADRQVRC